MKCLIAIIILAFLGAGQSSSQPSRSSQLLDRFDAFLQSKESGWRFSEKPFEAGSDRCWRHWENNGSQLDISVIALPSPEAAGETLKQRMQWISVGPTRKLEGLGDEAYVYGSNRSGDVSIHFRSRHFYIRIWANSFTLHRMSKYLDQIIKAN